jgi:hypothetical protein
LLAFKFLQISTIRSVFGPLSGDSADTSPSGARPISGT